MNDFGHPPIPSPDQLPSDFTPTSIQREWKDAPKIVTGWAYPLTWLSIVVLPLIIAAIFLGMMEKESPAERAGMAIFYAVLWGVAIWHNRALKRGASYAWPVQIILSILGLCGFPVGTFINIYILSQWFKPETKAWFGQN